MTPELAKILAKYNIRWVQPDGRRSSTTRSGEGYYDCTMKGYKIAKENGLKVSFIAHSRTVC
jgi:uncharacterized protein